MAGRIDRDFIVVGAGMAGASAAAHLALRGSVAVLEREAHAGYHSTGRSAALFTQLYGNRTIRALTRASRSFLFDPPTGFAAVPLVHPRPTLFFATRQQLDALQRFRADAGIAAGTQLLSPEEVQRRVPIFRDGHVAAAALDKHSADMDVDALHQGYMRLAKVRGAGLHFSTAPQAIEHTAGRWLVRAGDETWSAPVLVNAAGAWADELATLAGAAPLGLQPLRRTALLIDAPEGAGRMADWPAAIDIDEQFYFKPDAGLLLLSPADETPSSPCDVQPEELDVAIAVDRFETATGLRVKRVVRRWAGLRVFAPDRSPVLGFDAARPGFFWLAGQGGYGIQTAPAMAEAAAALASGEALPPALQAAGISAAELSPSRLMRDVASTH